MLAKLFEQGEALESEETDEGDVAKLAEVRDLLVAGTGEDAAADADAAPSFRMRGCSFLCQKTPMPILAEGAGSRQVCQHNGIPQRWKSRLTARTKAVCTFMSSGSSVRRSTRKRGRLYLQQSGWTSN